MQARQETGRWLNNRAENSHLPFPTTGNVPCSAFRQHAKFAEIRFRPLVHLQSLQSGKIALKSR